MVAGGIMLLRWLAILGGVNRWVSRILYIFLVLVHVSWLDSCRRFEEIAPYEHHNANRRSHRNTDPDKLFCNTRQCQLHEAVLNSPMLVPSSDAGAVGAIVGAVVGADVATTTTEIRRLKAVGTPPIGTVRTTSISTTV